MDGGAIPSDIRRVFTLSESRPQPDATARYVEWGTQLSRCNMTKRLKLKRDYHDATVTTIRYRERDIVLCVELDGYCNDPAGPATISFLDVGNFEEVRETLESARRENSDRGFIDQIIGIVKDDDRVVCIDFQSAGAVLMNPRSIFEA